MSRKNNPHDDLQSELKVYKMVNARVRSKQASMSTYAKGLLEETGKDALLGMVKNYVAGLCVKYYEDPDIVMKKTIQSFMAGKLLCRFRQDLSSERDPSYDYRPTLIFEVGEYGYQMIIHPAKYHSKSGVKILSSMFESLSQDSSVTDMATIVLMSDQASHRILFGQ